MRFALGVALLLGGCSLYFGHERPDARDDVVIDGRRPDAYRPDAGVDARPDARVYADAGVADATVVADAAADAAPMLVDAGTLVDAPTDAGVDARADAAVDAGVPDAMPD